MTQKLSATLRVAEGGRIVIPAKVRERLGLEVGSEVFLTVEDDHATLISREGALRRARELVRRYISPDVDLCAELMAERKLEAERE